MQATSQGLPADHPRFKQQVNDSTPMRIKELKFGILSHSDIIRQGVLEVCDRSLYDLDKGRAARENGPVDTRMGVSSKTGNCATCGQNLQDCNGHFGYVRLALPAFHVGYFKMILTVLQQICKDCSEILLVEADRRRFLRALRRPGIDNLAKTQICKKVLEQCKKTKTCFQCGATNGIIKKVGQPPLKIIHDKFRAFNASSAKKKEPPQSKVDFDASFIESKKTNTEIDRHVKKAMDDLNPLKVLRLFKKISPDTCELLGMQPGEGRPEMFIWQYVPAPPVCIRPSVTQDGASTEDDITSKLGDIVHISTLISTGLKKGAPISQLVEQWDFLQLQIALYVNADSPGLTQLSSGKPIRGFCQRLKGKQGRFRGNLSGKRVNFSGRTVISPDPNLQIDQVAVPILVAKNMTYPEKVFAANLDRLRQAVENGPNKHPGANYVLKGDKKFSLKHGKPAHNAKRLQIGDVVERHLIDDDIVLFNRQPSLHKLSILCHRVKVKPHRTFRLNECVCNPYNADFDGDEMNLHVPQTEEARTEAAELMGVKYNLATPKNGEPIIAAIQDFITGSYLLSRKDVFYDRKTFMQICMGMVDGKTHVDLPPPSIIKPVALWTGKQVFNVLMRPNKQSNILVNLDGACKSYKAADDQGHHRDLNPNDAWLTIRNSEVMCGMMDKSTVGSGKKDSLFYVILRDFGPDAAVETMSRLAKLSARWLTEQGFSIGIGDVTPGTNLREEKQKLIKDAYAKCDEVIAQFNAGSIKKAPGCDEEQTMETTVSGILSKVRSTAGDVCLQELSRRNSALVMANSGSKGSFINVSQMVASVGQQIIGEGRVIDGFQDRSLPHFPKMARQPESKGFVQNSFFSGLNPSEFIFHAMSGREGLVDTAVKTAETGYMSRRLIKSLEDLSTRYDDTVRNSSSQIVQFQFGDDKLDPVDMEGNAKPVNFERTFLHSESTTWSNDERGLLPDEVLDLKEKLLESERKKYPRTSLSGQTAEYDNKKIALQDVDGSESARDFIESIARYVEDRVDHQVVVRKTLGLSSGKPSGRRTKVFKEQQVATKAYEQVAKISETTLRTFINNCLLKYRKAQVEPGHAVGAVGAQSIGEPGTQMTLKTFHFAGVAGMSITGGVPRIKEIINASKTISTPVISCPLIKDTDQREAQRVRSSIEKTFLRDVIAYIEVTWSGRDSVITFQLDFDAMANLQLGIGPNDICRSILANKKFKLTSSDMTLEGNLVHIDVRETDMLSKKGKGKGTELIDHYERVSIISRAIPNTVIRGYPDANRVVITESKSNTFSVAVEGYGLKACMNTDGVRGTAVQSNSVMEMRDVLGIEAARATIIIEIAKVMDNLNIDPRHMQLLADVMTFKGDVLGITRFGLSKMRDSVLQLASFEKTPDHLFEAAWHMKSDKIEGVSECIIMGQPMSIGTGAFNVVMANERREGDVKKRKTLFEDCWREVMAKK